MRAVAKKESHDSGAKHAAKEPEKSHAAEVTPAAPVRHTTACPCGGGCPRCQSSQKQTEPSGAAADRSAMSDAFGVSFSQVRLRTDQPLENGARAAASRDEIHFAPGAYQHASEEGRFRIAHEFAHVAQFLGGNAVSKPELSNAEAAEADARQAAAAVLLGLRPVVAAYRNLGPLYDNGPRTVKTSDDVTAFEVLNKSLDTEPDGDQREGAIQFMVDLAMKKGPVQKIASDRVKLLLAGVPHKNIFDHTTTIEALKSYVAYDAHAYDLLLFGRFWFADHSKDEIGSGLVVPIFQRYLEHAGGKWAIIYLRSRLTGSDQLVANLAARIISDLLELQNTPRAQKYQENYNALRRMAMENDWGSKGPLGAASATPQIFSALDSIRQEADKLARMIRMGPPNDPWGDTDVSSLEKMVGNMSAKGMLKRGRDLFFTAENREETEHELLLKKGADTGKWLTDMAHTLTLASDFGLRVEQRVQLLQENALIYDQLLGKESETLDDRAALLDLRHEYIDTWLSFASFVFSGESWDLAAVYQGRINEVEHKLDRFDQVVAQRKFQNAHQRFYKFYASWNEGYTHYPAHDKIDDTFLSNAHILLHREAENLTARYTTTSNMSIGTTPVVITNPQPNIPNNLALANALDRDTFVFGMQVALFLHYESNVALANALAKSSLDKDFRAEQGQRLTHQRIELERIWNHQEWKTLIDKDRGFAFVRKDVIQKINDEADTEFWENLAITVIAALVTEGASLALEAVAVSDFLALGETARAISAFPTLFEASVFTGAQVTAGMAFGQDITVGDVVKDFATNLAFSGALKGIGKFTEPFAPGSKFGKLLFGHMVGFSGVAGVSALMTRIQTGEWPPDMWSFLKQTALTYALVAGMHGAFSKLATEPVLKSIGASRLEDLATANRALFEDLQSKVDSGKLTKEDFEKLRAERSRLIKEARAIADILKEKGVIDPADYEAIKKMSERAVADADNATFPVRPASDPVVHGLPSPEGLDQLVRVGDTSTYIYDPTRPQPEINTMLEQYRDRGYTIEGNPELLRIVDPSGQTRFQLRAGTVPASRLLLPLGSAPNAELDSPLARASGLRGAELDSARGRLNKINREAETKLPAEYPDYSVISTFSMLLEQAGVIKPNWPIDAVRGLADALSLQRGIPRSAVRRLFGAVPADQIPALFEAFHDIATSSKVSSAAKYLIADDLIPRKSVALIEACRKMMSIGLELPADMDMRATRGLSKQIEFMPNGWADWLAKIAKDKRGQRLRGVSGLRDPRVKIPENLTDLFANVTADIDGYPGLNPLAGVGGDAFVKEIETRNPNAKFDGPALRANYVRMVDNFRMQVAEVEQGKDLQHGNLEPFVGLANEVRRIAKVLLDGNKILAVDPRSQLPNINLSDVAFPGGGKLDNGPVEKNVFMDLLFADPAGKMTAMELTTGEVKLPKELAALDPKNPNYGKNVDWSAISSPEPTASQRKFQQAIKIYMLNKVGVAIFSAWGGKPVDPASVVMSAGDFDAPAARALESLGFRLEFNDGTPVTAAEIEARDKKK